MAKIFGTELEQQVVRAGMELMGLYGQCQQGGPFALGQGSITSGYLMTISATIAAGSSEINRNIIATRGLGLPR